jgi:hypothetical protein
LFFLPVDAAGSKQVPLRLSMEISGSNFSAANSTLRCETSSKLRCVTHLKTRNGIGGFVFSRPKSFSGVV